MADLFQISGGDVRVLRSVPFRQDHVEEDLQRWADANPHFLNGGAPMISLGREIATTHGHWIDNLFLDGSGCVVVAELKRGRTPREVTGQLLDYAVFANDLTRDDIEKLCRGRQKDGLEVVFERTFGSPLPDDVPTGHRLLIVAEDFDDRTIEHCIYMMTNGTPLACMQFRYFTVGSAEIIETQMVVGDLPSQDVPVAASASGPYEARFKWLFGELRGRIESMAAGQSWEPRIETSKWSLSFAPADWPDDYWKRAFFVSRRTSDKVVDLGFWYHIPAFPDLKERIEAEGRASAGLSNVTYRSSRKTQYVMFHQAPLPEIGNVDKVQDFTDILGEVVSALKPTLDPYFEAKAVVREASD
ncbi:MAG: hypothetical protein IIC82_07785 [Chloroflexi bacterium]|nr:hypothetical protein [Chloroflexota bacterium]